jgi:hypothetical protein
MSSPAANVRSMWLGRRRDGDGLERLGGGTNELVIDLG